MPSKCSLEALQACLQQGSPSELWKDMDRKEEVTKGEMLGAGLMDTNTVLLTRHHSYQSSGIPVLKIILK